MKKISVSAAALVCALVMTACMASSDGPGRPIAPFIGDHVTEIDITHYISGQEEQWTLTDSEEIARLSQWASELKYEHRQFEDGQSPGDGDGGEVYVFTLSPGGNAEGYPGFSYVINGPEDCWLLIEGYWFSVKNPLDPPVSAPLGGPGIRGGRVEDIYYVAPRLSLNALKSLVDSRGENLNWSDFALYESDDIGSGLYIRRYPIDDTLCLLIGGGSPDSSPMYIKLAVVGADGFITDNCIDVRTENIDNFINELNK